MVAVMSGLSQRERMNCAVVGDLVRGPPSPLQTTRVLVMSKGEDYRPSTADADSCNDWVDGWDEMRRVDDG
jgi:hypothetical protein